MTAVCDSRSWFHFCGISLTHEGSTPVLPLVAIMGTENIKALLKIKFRHWLNLIYM